MPLGRAGLKSKSDFLFHLEGNCHAIASEPETIAEEGGFQGIRTQAEERLGLDLDENPQTVCFFPKFPVTGDCGAQNSGEAISCFCWLRAASERERPAARRGDLCGSESS